MVCSMLTMLFDRDERRVMRNQARLLRPLYTSLETQMAATGIRNVYGTYWVVQPAQVLVPGALTGPLWARDGAAHYHAVLVPPSRRCVKGEVLYVVDGPSEEEATIARQVLARGGRLLDAPAPRQAVYIGPPVWEQDGCP
jgi:hypothetical protein